MEIASIIIAIALLVMIGLFSYGEASITQARKAKLFEMADEDSKGAKRVLKMLEREEKILATVDIAKVILSLALVTILIVSWVGSLAFYISQGGLSYSISCGFAALIIVVIAIILVSLFGILMPKQIALSNPERAASLISAYLKFFETSLKPIVAFLFGFSSLLARLFGASKDESTDQISEEEIKILVNEHDDLLDEEKRMIGEIFDLGDTVAREIMVPRVDIAMVEDTANVGEVVDRMRGTGFSRIPVYHDDPDNIVGIAMVKDLLAALIDNKKDKSIVTYMREPVFVPETKDILPLLSEMQSEHQQLVIVVDEYGGTAGLVSIEDIVEEVVGEIADEYDADRKYITRVSDGQFIVDGRLGVDDAIEEGIPIEESDDYDTVAGWLMAMIDHIPRPGDSFDLGRIHVTVQSMRRERISLIKIVLQSKEPAEDSDIESDFTKDGIERSEG